MAERQGQQSRHRWRPGALSAAHGKPPLSTTPYAPPPRTFPTHPTCKERVNEPLVPSGVGGGGGHCRHHLLKQRSRGAHHQHACLRRAWECELGGQRDFASGEHIFVVGARGWQGGLGHGCNAWGAKPVWAGGHPSRGCPAKQRRRRRQRQRTCVDALRVAHDAAEAITQEQLICGAHSNGVGIQVDHCRRGAGAGRRGGGAGGQGRRRGRRTAGQGGGVQQDDWVASGWFVGGSVHARALVGRDTCRRASRQAGRLGRHVQADRLYLARTA